MEDYRYHTKGIRYKRPVLKRYNSKRGPKYEFGFKVGML